MPKKLYKDIPKNFGICLHDDCPRAGICLRRIVYPSLLERDAVLMLVNPLRCTKDGACPYFRDSAPRMYARGFTGMQQRMFPAQYMKFMSILKSRWEHNFYYERRRGDAPLSPDDQAFVLAALRQAGVTEEMQFDKYEEGINWYD